MLEPAFSGTGLPGSLKICVLISEDAFPWNPGPYLRDYHWESYYVNRLNSVHRVQELVKRDFDVFLNFCDADWTQPLPGPEVVQVLEEAGVAFTGGNQAFFDPSREDMKRVCRYYDLRAPEGVEIAGEADIDRAARELAFPLIVKILNSYGSIGIERESRVTTPEALRRQAHRVIAEFGSALVEEFIEGREFTVLVAENPDDPARPKAYRPVEFIFPPGETFKHHKLKWEDWEQMRARAVQDPELAERLMDAGRKLFVGLNGVSFGRCDLRMNPAGDIFVLEINPNCGVFYAPDEPGSADYVLQNDPEGHRGFIERIIRAALARKARLRKKYQARHHPGKGYGLYARQAIAAGEVILPFEQRPHTLVSRSLVLQSWPADRQRLFERRAYPLTDEVWVSLSDDPGEWTPVRHSCDPNAWWTGLDITARRGISAGEEITLDYATFHNEVMPEFACGCGAPGCRRTIRGMDYLEPFVDRYGAHVTDYVRQKRMAARSGMPILEEPSGQPGYFAPGHPGGVFQEAQVRPGSGGDGQDRQPEP